MPSKMDDGWLTTRNKSKVQPKSSRPKYRTSLPKQKSAASNRFLLTQNSPPPKQLFSSTKQSSLTTFFKPVGNYDDLHEVPFQHDSDHISSCSEDHDGKVIKHETPSETENALNIPGNDELYYDDHQCVGTEGPVSRLNNKSTVDEEPPRIDQENQNERHSGEPDKRAVKRKYEFYKEILCDSDITNNESKQNLDMISSKRRRLDDNIELRKVDYKNDCDLYNSMGIHFLETDSDSICLPSPLADSPSANGDNRHIELHRGCREEDEIGAHDSYTRNRNKNDVLHERQTVDAIKVASHGDVIDDSGQLSFLDTNTSVAQSLDFLSDFTLRSQREKYDALEMNYKQGEDDSDGVSLFELHSDTLLSTSDRPVSDNESDLFVLSQ